MNNGLATTDQTISFRLSGHLAFRSTNSDEIVLDPNYFYEIIITPGREPQGTITQLDRDDAKPIPIELPEEIKGARYEKIYSFLFQNPSKLIVLNDGYEKMGNRKLLILFAIFSTPSPVNSTLLVEGISKDTAYRLIIDPHDLTRSTGQIQDTISNDFKNVQIHLEDIISIKADFIKKMFTKLKPCHFNVTIVKDRLIVYQGQSLKEFIVKLNADASRQLVKKAKMQDWTEEEVSYDIDRLFAENQSDTILSNEKERLSIDADSLSYDCDGLRELLKPLDQKFFVKGSRKTSF